MSYRTKKSIPTPGGILPGDVMYEQIAVGLSSQFIRYAKGKTPTVEPFISVGESVLYTPLQPSFWPLPEKPKPYGSDQELWDTIKDYVWIHVDMENPIHYDIYAAWVLTTWRMEGYDATSYLHFHGPTTSGKTRALNVLKQLCYRSITAINLTGPVLFRTINRYHPTFLVDEFEVYSDMKEQKADILGVLRAGQKRDSFILRLVKVGGEYEEKPFWLFGPKAVASIMRLPGAALESRCIRIPMSKATRKVRKRIDRKSSVDIRSMLLQYRLDHIFDEISDEIPIDLPDGRLIELFWPLVNVAPTEEIKKSILRFAEKQHNVTIEEARSTWDAQVFNIIFELLGNAPSLRLQQQVIRDTFNASIPPEAVKERLSKQRLGAILKRLNIESRYNTALKAREIVVDPAVLERRKNVYILAEELPLVNVTLERLREMRESASMPTKLDDGEWAKQRGVQQEQMELILEKAHEIKNADGEVYVSRLLEVTQLPDLERLLRQMARGRKAPIFFHRPLNDKVFRLTGS